MPSLGKQFSFATLKARFGNHSDTQRSRSRPSTANGKRSESLPPELTVPVVPYNVDASLPTPDSLDKTDNGSPNSTFSENEKPSLHQRALTMPTPATMPIPASLPLDKPIPPLPDQPSPIPFSATSPDSFSSSIGAPSSLGSDPMPTPTTLPMSPPMTPLLSPPMSPPMSLTSTLVSPPMYPMTPPMSPPVFSPLMNLHAVGVLAQIDEGPKTTKAEKFLNKLDDTYTSANDPKGLLSQGVSAVKSVLDSSGALKAIENGINSFVDDIPWLMKGLDEVAKIHPVVTVAVLAFKAVYTMEMTRRENDKRIRSLYVEMKEMIAVLVQLKDVKDPEDRGPDGKTISARMQTLCEKAASDIKDCANACDSYSKKRLVVKVLKGHTWETKLVGFVSTFTTRKADFQQALAIHTARTVDAIQSMVQGIDAKMELFFKVFAANVPANEQLVRDEINKKGMDFNTLINDGPALNQLNKFENENIKRAGSESSNQKMRSEFSLEDLKTELFENLDTAISSNFDIFERKFTLHQNRLHEQLNKSMQEIMVAVREGPHDKIRNPELKEMWKEMNWRRNVKASLFVMTLRDHFREKGEEDSSGIEALEDWALKYIDATWLQSIMEAFDDDASGYVTIVELNRFADAKPENLNWSLPHWIAYWAIGFQLTTQKYKAQIEEVMAKMYSMIPYLLPENRKWADYYLSCVFTFVSQIICGIQFPNEVEAHLADKFTAYVDYEEDRIRKNLELIRYDIDALDTIPAIIGGKIEKHILPLTYLLLARDLKLFRLAQTHVLNDEELWDAADSLMWVNDAAVYRMKDLKVLFKQRKLDVAAQFHKFSYGMLDYMFSTAPLWSMEKIIKRETPFPYKKYTLEELTADPAPDPKDVLNYPIKEQHPIAYDAFEVFDNTGAANVPLDVDETNLVNLIKGTWNGYAYLPEVFPTGTMDTYHFNPNSTDEPTFACDCAGHRLNTGPYKLTGSCSKDEDGTLRVKFQTVFENGKGTEYFIGHVDEQGSLVGYRSWSDDVSVEKHNALFIFRRVPPEIMCMRPSPAELSENKYRSFWRFACKAVLREVRRNRWSWSYFSERRNIRTRYIKLNINVWTYGRSLIDEETVEFLSHRRSLTPSESVFYRSIRDQMLVTIPKHHSLICDYCRNPFGGVRFLCLDCPTSDQKFWDTCDADDMACFANDINRGEDIKHHRPNHDFIKLRTVMNYRHLPDVYQNAWDSLAKARAFLAAVTPLTAEEAKALEARVSHEHDEADVNSSSIKAAHDELRTNGTNGVPHAESSDSEGHSDSENHPPLTGIFSLAVTINGAVKPHQDATNEVPHCTVCKKDVTIPCWFCTECPECFLCDSCEEKCQLPCVACSQPFVQPSWYYGGQPGDNFLCNVCSVKGVKPPADIDKSTLHVYTHPLVRCKIKVLDPIEDAQPTTEERINTLQTMLDELRDKFASVETTLAAVQSILAAKFSAEENGHASLESGTTL